MLAFIGGLSLPTKLIMLGALVAFGFLMGWKTSTAFEDANDLASMKNQVKVVDKIREKAKPIIEAKVEAEKKLDKVYPTIRNQIHEKNDTRICFADSNALSLWNDAISGTNTPRQEHNGGAGGTNSAKGQDSDSSKENAELIATVEDVLLNATDNFEKANRNIVKHRACISQLKVLDGNVCACAAGQ